MAKSEKLRSARKAGEHDGPLTGTAAALEAELHRFQELTNGARDLPLNSQKNLEKAARFVSEAAQSQERVGELVRTLVSAVSAARERQNGVSESLSLRAQELQARTEEFRELLRAFVDLGQQAADVNVTVQEAAALQRDNATPEQVMTVLERLGDAHLRMGSVVQNAASLTNLAEAKGMVDIARQAESIRAQMAAARNKLKLFQERLSARTAYGTS